MLSDVAQHTSAPSASKRPRGISSPLDPSATIRVCGFHSRARARDDVEPRVAAGLKVEMNDDEFVAVPREQATRFGWSRRAVHFEAGRDERLSKRREDLEVALNDQGAPGHSWRRPGRRRTN